jgi:putative oxidoreductase
MVAALGLPAPALAAWATSLIELGGGILMMLGAFLVPLSLPLAAMTAVAMFGVHLRYGFLSVRLKALSGAARSSARGLRISLLYLAGIATLALGGSPPFSLDRLLESRRSTDEASRPSKAWRDLPDGAKVKVEVQKVPDGQTEKGED